MPDTLSHQIQEACDDLYCSPLDPVAQANVRDLLQQSTPALDERTLAARPRVERVDVRGEQPLAPPRHAKSAVRVPALAA